MGGVDDDRDVRPSVHEGARLGVLRSARDRARRSRREPLFRTVDFFALNNIFVPTPARAVAVRYGYNRFKDFGGNYPEFDAATLGFPSSLVDAMTFNTFPTVNITGYNGLGNGGPNRTTHVTQTANASISHLKRNHTLKFGGEYRRIGADVRSFSSSAGTYSFTQAFTAPTPTRVGRRRVRQFPAGLSGDRQHRVRHAREVSGRLLRGLCAGRMARQSDADGQLRAALRVRTGRARSRQPVHGGFRQGRRLSGTGARPRSQRRADVCRRERHIRRARARRSTALRRAAGLRGRCRTETSFAAATDSSGRRMQFSGVGETAMGRTGYTATTTYLASTDGNRTPANSLSDPFPSGISPRREARWASPQERAA